MGDIRSRAPAHLGYFGFTFCHLQNLCPISTLSFSYLTAVVSGGNGGLGNPATAMQL